MESIMYLIIGLVVIVAIFFLVREIITWYFKLNEIVDEMKVQTKALKAIFKQLGGEVKSES